MKLLDGVAGNVGQRQVAQFRQDVAHAAFVVLGASLCRVSMRHVVILDERPERQRRLLCGGLFALGINSGGDFSAIFQGLMSGVRDLHLRVIPQLHAAFRAVYGVAQEKILSALAVDDHAQPRDLGIGVLAFFGLYVFWVRGQGVDQLFIEAKLFTHTLLVLSFWWWVGWLMRWQRACREVRIRGSQPSRW